MQIICTLAGASFRPAASKEVLRTAEPGDEVILEPDADNEYDPRAVRVMLEGEHIGFIPRDSNGPIFEALVEGNALTGTIIMFEAPLKPVLEIQL